MSFEISENCKICVDFKDKIKIFELYVTITETRNTFPYSVLNILRYMCKIISFKYQSLTI